MPARREGPLRRRAQARPLRHQHPGRICEYVPVCPEVECGLPIPREAMRLVGDPAPPPPDREDPRRPDRPHGGMGHRRSASWNAKTCAASSSRATPPAAAWSGSRSTSRTACPRRAGWASSPACSWSIFPCSRSRTRDACTTRSCARTSSSASSFCKRSGVCWLAGKKHAGLSGNSIPATSCRSRPQPGALPPDGQAGGTTA